MKTTTREPNSLVKVDSNDILSDNWDQWINNIEYTLKHLKRKGANVSELKLSSPLPIEKISEKQWYGVINLDDNFQRIITEFAGNISFSWYFDDDSQLLHPAITGAYEESFMWDSQNYWSTSETIFEELGFEGGDYITLGMTAGGDCVAIDMTTKGHPVILITHDGCSKDEAHNKSIGEMDYFQGKRLGLSFVDFMNRWTNWGCFSFEEQAIEFFYDYENQCLIDSGERLEKWKSWLKN